MPKWNKIEKKWRTDLAGYQEVESLECVFSVIQRLKFTANGHNKAKLFWKEPLRGAVDLSYIYSW